MKTLRHLLMATCFVFSLSVVSFAGDIETPGAPVPPPPPAAAQCPDLSESVGDSGIWESLTVGLLCQLF
jgi:hypothetical protein